MKKIQKYKYIVLVLLGIALMPGCKKFDDINKDPNNPLDVPPATQFVTANLLTAYNIGGEMSRISGLLTQQVIGVSRQSQLQYTYIFGNADFDAPWGNAYQAMVNYRDLYTKAAAAGNNRYAGMAKIMTAYNLGMSLDVFDDMPYSEAFRGTELLQPAFDNPQFLYDTVQFLLDDGLADLAKSPGSLVPGADDIIYGGDASSWMAMAHGLKARFYLHLAKVNGGASLTQAQAEVTTAIGSWVDDAYFFFGNTNTNAGPWFQFQQQRAGDIQFNQSFAGQLFINNNDPRLDAFIDTTQNNIGAFYGTEASGIQMITLAELYFIQSEIAMRNSDAGTAATASNNGVIASVEAITADAIDTTSAFYTSFASETGGTVTLEKIMTQKYLALWLNPESYSDWRRTGFPTLSTTPGSTLGGIPRRYLYAQTEKERNRNTFNFLQPLTSPVWWDQ